MYKSFYFILLILVIGGQIICAAEPIENPPYYLHKDTKNAPFFVYLNQQGKPAIDKTFDKAKPFSEGFAAVREGRQWQLIDAKGTPVFSFEKMDSLESPSEGLAVAYADKKKGYVNTKGEWVIEMPAAVSSHYSFKEGFARFRNKNGKEGFIDRTGKMVVPAKYVRARAFAGGLALVSMTEDEDGKLGLLNDKGKEILSPKYYRILPGKEGIAAVKDKRGGKWGFIDKRGKWIAKFKYLNATAFNDGLAGVSVEAPAKSKQRQGRHTLSITSHSTLWGFIDSTGRMIIKPVFSSAREFSDGLAAVAVEQGFGYINKSGRFVIRPKYSVAYSFEYGKAIAKLGDPRKPVCGLINKTGRTILPHRHDEIFVHPHDFYSVTYDLSGKYWILNKTGRKLVKE